jgi:hypothetical protein
MSDVDTSRETVERKAQWLVGFAFGRDEQMSGELHACAATLRALLARAEAAEAKLDALRAEWKELREWRE